jgi:hypothetical protein
MRDKGCGSDIPSQRVHPPRRSQRSICTATCETPPTLRVQVVLVECRCDEALQYLAFSTAIADWPVRERRHNAHNPLCRLRVRMFVTGAFFAEQAAVVDSKLQVWGGVISRLELGLGRVAVLTLVVLTQAESDNSDRRIAIEVRGHRPTVNLCISNLKFQGHRQRGGRLHVSPGADGVAVRWSLDRRGKCPGRRSLHSVDGPRCRPPFGPDMTSRSPSQL